MGKRVIMTTLACPCSLVLGGMPKIVSQTEKGVFSFTGSLIISIPKIGNLNTTANGTMDYYIDADMGSARIDFNMGGEQPTNTSYLLSGNEKRLYSYDSTARHGCSFMEFPALPEPAQYFGCAEKLLAGGKKFFQDIYTIKDEGKESKLGPVTLGGSYVLGLHIEKDGGIRKMDFGGSLDLLKIPAFVYGGGFNATTTSLAKPDATVFDVPAAWGECTKEKDPFSHMDDFSKTEQAWLKCLKSASSETLDVVLV
jgi:hypothetical protein